MFQTAMFLKIMRNSQQLLKQCILDKINLEGKGSSIDQLVIIKKLSFKKKCKQINLNKKGTLVRKDNKIKDRLKHILNLANSGFLHKNRGQ